MRRSLVRCAYSLLYYTPCACYNVRVVCVRSEYLGTIFYSNVATLSDLVSLLLVPGYPRDLVSEVLTSYLLFYYTHRQQTVSSQSHSIIEGIQHEVAVITHGNKAIARSSERLHSVAIGAHPVQQPPIA